MNKIFARILVFVIVIMAGLLVVNAWLGPTKSLTGWTKEAVLVNLNSIDAMPEGGKLRVGAKVEE
jgi:hypothetical protein